MSNIVFDNMVGSPDETMENMVFTWTLNDSVVTTVSIPLSDYETKDYCPACLYVRGTAVVMSGSSLIAGVERPKCPTCSGVLMSAGNVCNCKQNPHTNACAMFDPTA